MVKKKAGILQPQQNAGFAGHFAGFYRNCRILQELQDSAGNAGLWHTWPGAYYRSYTCQEHTIDLIRATSIL